MKTINSLLLFFGLLCTCQLARAQQLSGSSRASKWTSDKGFWVIESNLKTPKSSLVQFYTNNHQLIYSEKVEGIVLKVQKKKTLMTLKKALDQAVIAWERDGQVVSKGQLLAARDRKK